jgi:NAD-dependent dihydropyrimidine dehydrogenase PreA subunit
MSAKIEINLNECTGCRTCAEACFVDVIRWDDAEEKPVVAYERDCVWCFTCEINCPSQCINVIPQMEGQTVSPY